MLKSLTINGGKPLHGTVKISGAKNAASKMMIASLLTDQPVTLHNCPDIGEVDITAEICEMLGTQLERNGDSLTLHTPQVTSTTIRQQTRRNRLSILALAPLLHREKHAELPVAHGDMIGPRPVNFMIDALAQMGADIDETEEKYTASTEGLHGSTITLGFPSVMATESIILAATLAKGRTYIHNAAIEPEIMDLIKMLQQMGAIIEFRANRLIIIEGVEKLHGVEYSVLPDRLEAASFACLALASDGDIMCEGAIQADMLTFLNVVRRIGGSYVVSDAGIRFKRKGELRGIEVETEPFPGFSTDYQQPLAVALTQANGASVVHETIFEDRFGYTDALNTMGANITVFNKCLGEVECRFNGLAHKHSAVINGPTPLHGHDIEMPDIRAGMAYVIAGLIADGTTELTGVDHLIRGYGIGFLDKLKAVGADFEAHYAETHEAEPTAA